MVKVTALGFVAQVAKILDANEDDTHIHICSVATSFPPNTVAVIIKSKRISGTGSFYVYPNEGTELVQVVTQDNDVLYAFKVGSLNLKFQQSVASDDWDIYSLGYFTEGQVKK